MIELGVIQEDEPIELLDGQLVVRDREGPEHAAGVRRVLAVLQPVAGDAWQVDCCRAFALDADSEPEPDVAVVPFDPQYYRAGHPSRAVLLVEVSDSSYRIDHTYKASLYARAGVPEYWVVDVAHARLEVHRAPAASSEAPYGWRYSSVTVLPKSDEVTLLFAPTVTIRIADLLI